MPFFNWLFVETPPKASKAPLYLLSRKVEVSKMVSGFSKHHIPLFVCLVVSCLCSSGVRRIVLKGVLRDLFGKI